MLTPKKTGNFDKKSWEDLDKLLQANIDPEKHSKPWATINPDDYEMSTEEIVSAAEKAKYSVIVSESGQIRFE